MPKYTIYLRYVVGVTVAGSVNGHDPKEAIVTGDGQIKLAELLGTIPQTALWEHGIDSLEVCSSDACLSDTAFELDDDDKEIMQHDVDWESDCVDSYSL
jgi:hypothetical protein